MRLLVNGVIYEKGENSVSICWKIFLEIFMAFKVTFFKRYMAILKKFIIDRIFCLLSINSVWGYFKKMGINCLKY